MLGELVYKNRSYRSFDESRAIARDELLSFIDIARLTPATRNLQPLCYRPVCTPDECAQMLSLTGWAALLKDITLPPKGHAPTAYIVICDDTTIGVNPTAYSRDVGIAAQTIMLAACESGLGGCMIGSFNPDKIRTALCIDDKYLPMLILALGKPDESIVIKETVDGNIDYYRDGGVHTVPKRPLKEIII